uniref:Ninja-family protein n=1 Tax=Kalanchoe fedtschenkoi TaxID=63787 RepID=A0A7N0V169_KALFE
MAESGESRVTGSLDTGIKYDGYSKDLLTFFSSNPCSNARFDYGEEEEVELTLELSLNGRFGVNPNAPKLARSSSIPEYMNPSAPPDKAAAARQVCGSLARTSSLPVEPEAEVRKRKEMQSLRRREAKRKRAEKQRHLMSTRAAKEREGQGSVAPAPATIPIPIPRMRVKGLGGSEKLMIRSTGSTVVSQSQGSCSESESQVVEGTGKSGGEAKSLLLASVDQIESEQDKEEAGAGLARCSSLGTSGMKSQFNKLTVSDNGSATSESAARHVMMPDMPCVSTQGTGPDGKRVEGFLYRYSKSEEVRIVCVCHGRFLSPAEFVKHAGGTDVDQPLKHITVTPSATFLQQMLHRQGSRVT